jgi:hypothetical protein
MGEERLRSRDLDSNSLTTGLNAFSKHLALLNAMFINISIEIRLIKLSFYRMVLEKES